MEKLLNKQVYAFETTFLCPIVLSTCALTHSSSRDWKENRATIMKQVEIMPKTRKVILQSLLIRERKVKTIRKSSRLGGLIYIEHFNHSIPHLIRKVKNQLKNPTRSECKDGDRTEHTA